MIHFPAPGDVFLDTSVVLAALYPDTTNSQAAKEFCEDLRQAGSTVYFADVLRVEFARGIRRMATIPGLLPADVFQSFDLQRWGSHPLIRRRWLSNGVRRFSTFVNTFARYIDVPLHPGIWLQSIEIMATDGFNATDAVHLATARWIGVGTFATADSDFRRITWPAIHLVRDV